MALPMDVDGARRLELWLAPLRGVTIRAFREVFAGPMREAGFTGSVAPFLPANPGMRSSDRMVSAIGRELGNPSCGGSGPLALVPQVITRHPDAMRTFLKNVKAAGFTRADLNAGCPFPMIVRRGRGAGLLKTPKLLEELLDAGCGEMGPGRFSLKIRLGISEPGELLSLMPAINRFPLAFLAVHARTARQQYEGVPDAESFRRVCEASGNPVIYNGDVDIRDPSPPAGLDGLPRLRGLMVGRSFIRRLGERDDAAGLLREYVGRSRMELSGDRPVLGRVKELVSYWRETPRWRRLWPMLKVCNTLAELSSLLGRDGHGG